MKTPARGGSEWYRDTRRMPYRKGHQSNLFQKGLRAAKCKLVAVACISETLKKRKHKDGHMKIHTRKKYL